MPVSDCQVLDTEPHCDPRGALLAFEHPATLPFRPVRTFVLYDVTEGASRGHHAHRTCHEGLVVFGGRARIAISDPSRRTVVTLDRPTQLLHLTPMTWIDIEALSPDAVCVVLCSHPYDEADYLRDWSAFVQESACPA